MLIVLHFDAGYSQIMLMKARTRQLRALRDEPVDPDWQDKVRRLEVPKHRE